VRLVLLSRILLTLVALCPALCVKAEEPAAKGRRIVMESLAALGGDAFLHVTDRVEEGRAYSFFNQQLSGLSKAKIYVRYLIVPEPPVVAFQGQRERQVFGKDKDETAYVLFDEKQGYNVSYRGAKPFTTADYERYRESLLHNVLYILRMRLNEPGMALESRGTEMYNNVPVDSVDIIDSDNRVVTVYFEQSTHYPVRQRWYRRNAVSKEKDEEITVFSKYRETNGVFWPWVIQRERNGERFYEMFSESVSFNTGVTDEKFMLPASTKIIQGVSVSPARKK
jgi:hypothetical protein